mgnify:FL=1|tara:strand:+ start:2099 stop:2509 length:411 start_codon:yes stop_codon:yes gene_type:complete
MATTKIEATNRELLEVFRGLESVKQIKGARFSVLVGKNLKELRHKLEPLEKAAEPTFEFQEVSVKMQSLVEAQDADAMEKLEKDNETLIEERKAQLQAVEDMLDEPTEAYLHMIKESQLPEEITGEHIERLLTIIQ